jgi:hypothetical protein
MYVNGSDAICGGSELQFQDGGQDFPGNKRAIPGTAQPTIQFDRQTHLDRDDRQQAGKNGKFASIQCKQHRFPEVLHSNRFSFS